MRTLFLSLSLAAIFTATSFAENRFCIGGDIDHLSSAERQSCNAQVNAARKLVAGNPAVDGWHFVVVCGEGSWQDYSEFAHKDASLLKNVSFDADSPSRTIFLRGGSLQTNNLIGFSEIKDGLNKVSTERAAR